MNHTTHHAGAPGEPRLHVAIGILRGALVVIPVPVGDAQPLCPNCLIPYDTACAMCAPGPEAA